MVGWVAGKAENITNSAQLGLGLGLSLAITVFYFVEFIYIGFLLNDLNNLS